MKPFIWSPEKDVWLKAHRGVSFDDLISSRFLGIDENGRRAHQRLMIFEYKRYVWVVPYVEDVDHYFLKTAFPSRKHTQRFLGRE